MCTSLYKVNKDKGKEIKIKSDAREFRKEVYQPFFLKSFVTQNRRKSRKILDYSIYNLFK